MEGLFQEMNCLQEKIFRGQTKIHMERTCPHMSLAKPVRGNRLVFDTKDSEVTKRKLNLFFTAKTSQVHDVKEEAAQFRFKFSAQSFVAESWIHVTVKANGANPTYKPELTFPFINLPKKMQDMPTSRLYSLFLNTDRCKESGCIVQAKVLTNSYAMKKSYFTTEVTLRWTMTWKISCRSTCKCIAIPGVMKEVILQGNSAIQVYWIKDTKYHHYLKLFPNPCKSTWIKETDYEYCSSYNLTNSSYHMHTQQFILFWGVKQHQCLSSYAFSCWFRGKISKSFNEALNLCKKVGGSLPVIRDKDELHKLIAFLKLAKNMPPVEALYIGLVGHSNIKVFF